MHAYDGTLFHSAIATATATATATAAATVASSTTNGQSDTITRTQTKKQIKALAAAIATATAATATVAPNTKNFQSDMKTQTLTKAEKKAQTQTLTQTESKAQTEGKVQSKTLTQAQAQTQTQSKAHPSQEPLSAGWITVTKDCPVVRVETLIPSGTEIIPTLPDQSLYICHDIERLLYKAMKKKNVKLLELKNSAVVVANAKNGKKNEGQKPLVLDSSDNNSVQTLKIDKDKSAQIQKQIAKEDIIDILPIDAHREEILDRIKNNRITIIHGETGCGKSSRLPAILLEDADSRGEPCRMMVRLSEIILRNHYIH